MSAFASVTSFKNLTSQQQAFLVEKGVTSKDRGAVKECVGAFADRFGIFFRPEAVDRILLSAGKRRRRYGNGSRAKSKRSAKGFVNRPLAVRPGN